MSVWGLIFTIGCPFCGATLVTYDAEWGALVVVMHVEQVHPGERLRRDPVKLLREEGLRRAVN